MAALMVLAVGSLAAFLLCAIRGVLDLRARRFGWGIAELAVAAVLFWGLVTPVPTHAVKIDLPARS